MAERRVTISLTMTPDLVARATEAAKKQSVTRSALIAHALSDYLRALDKKERDGRK